jgi:hypothetical protein
MKTDVIFSLIAILALVLPPGIVVAQEAKSTPVSFSLFTAATSPESTAALAALLLSREGNSMTPATTFQEGIASPADILVVVMEKVDSKAIGEYHVEALKKRKVIGIG